MGFTSNSKHSQASSELEMFPLREGYRGDRFTAGSTVTTSASWAFGGGCVLGLGLFVVVLQPPRRGWSVSSQVPHFRQICHLYLNISQIHRHWVGKSSTYLNITCNDIMIKSNPRSSQYQNENKCWINLPKAKKKTKKTCKPKSICASNQVLN